MYIGDVAYLTCTRHCYCCIIIKYIIFDRGTCPVQRFPRAKPVPLLFFSDTCETIFSPVRTTRPPPRNPTAPEHLPLTI